VRAVDDGELDQVFSLKYTTTAHSALPWIVIHSPMYVDLGPGQYRHTGWMKSVIKLVA
jgi:hypothetical protein